jgi:formate hydrogenlyase subunit 3/multisubunit Na+/H+ antiporter MnhD subunit
MLWAMQNPELLLFILIPLLMSWLLPALPVARKGRIAGVMLGVLALALLLYLPSAAQTPQVSGIPWIPQVQLYLSLRLDMLALAFGVVFTGVSGFAAALVGGQTPDDAEIRYPLRLALLCVTALIGVALSSNLLLLFAFAEMTSLCLLFSAPAHPRSRLLVGLSGAALLFGVWLLGTSINTMDLTDPRVAQAASYPAASALILIGALLRGAHLLLPVQPRIMAYLAALVGVFICWRLPLGLGAWFVTALILAAMALVAVRRDFEGE